MPNNASIELSEKDFDITLPNGLKFGVGIRPYV
jgi:hypothetical protein